SERWWTATRSSEPHESSHPLWAAAPCPCAGSRRRRQLATPLAPPGVRLQPRALLQRHRAVRQREQLVLVEAGLVHGARQSSRVNATGTEALNAVPSSRGANCSAR